MYKNQFELAFEKSIQENFISHVSKDIFPFLLLVTIICSLAKWYIPSLSSYQLFSWFILAVLFGFVALLYSAIVDRIFCIFLLYSGTLLVKNVSGLSLAATIVGLMA